MKIVFVEQLMNSPEIHQIFSALGPLVLTLSVGTTFGYSAVLLPWLHTINNPSITVHTSWIASAAVLPLPLGSLLGGWLMSKAGRKITHLLATLPILSGWLLCNWPNDLAYLLSGRCLTGVGSGILTVCTAPYLSEVSAPPLRHFLLAAVSLGVATGIFLVHLVGFFDVGNTAYFCCGLVALGFVLSLWIPESPVWLLGRQRIEEAERNYKKLRGNSESAQLDFANLSAANVPDEKVTRFSDFLTPLTVIVAYLVINQWSGVNALTFYAVLIVEKSVGRQNMVAVLIVDCFRVLMSVLACFLLRKYSKRQLSIISGIGTSLSLFALTVYIYFTRNVNDCDLFTAAVLPIVCLVAYITFVTIGFVPIPWALMGEMFPLQWRSLGSALSSFVAFSAFFSVVKTGPLMIDTLGMDGTFLVYGSVAAAGTIFLFFVLPK